MVRRKKMMKIVHCDGVFVECYEYQYKKDHTIADIVRDNPHPNSCALKLAMI